MSAAIFRKKTIRSVSLKHFFKKNEPNQPVLDYKTLVEADSPQLTDQELLDAIKTAKEELDSAMESFDYAVTPEIIDGCIYKIKSCTEYYQYLIKLAKLNDLTTSYIPYRLKKGLKERGVKACRTCKQIL